MNETVCKRCNVYVDNPDLAQYVRAYIFSIDEGLRVTDEEYERRLAACRACDRLVNGLCALCGCFVEARAAKRAMRCAKSADIW